MEKIEQKRHSLAHLLAAAVLKLYPDAKPTIGPAVDNGFYYDFEFSSPISEMDLKKIEKQMKKLLPTWKEFEKIPVSESEAREKFADNPYKLELINEIVEKGEDLSLYKSGEFIDLCRGGHVDSMKEISADSFTLDKIAGAYWRGDEKNKMLTRIYGLAFDTKEELEEYKKMMIEAEKRDHRKLGPQLDLFFFHETSPGCPYWLPKGLIVLNELTNFWRKEHTKRGYLETSTPLVNKRELWETSGHWEHYQDDMFIAEMGENETYGIKPMNCPNAMVIFGSKPRSYRDLPLRLSDSDILHRYERSGTLNGLLRARSFRQDDSHNYITEDQIENEYREILEIADLFYGIFGLTYKLRLGTRPEGYLGDIETWNKAEEALHKILKEKVGEDGYEIAEGDGAFYGPKIDIVMKDSIGRAWQMGTIQLDFQQPKRFGLTYTDKDGKEKTPVVVHRVIYGSLERFIGILIEHYAGAFPAWIAPVQVAVIPVAEVHNEFAKNITDQLKDSEVRVELLEAEDSLGKRIRKAKMQKIPYLVIIGDKEKESGQLTIEQRDSEETLALSVEELVKKVRN